ncbi:MAG: glycoside hydrolase family 18, partial [Alistipes sp.]|nr:glycoside hydrolase family 18 [Alistipes sp.]
MKKSLIIISALLFLMACNTDVDNVVVNDVIEYDEDSEYYVNLRKYKESDHAICFGWYAAYTNEASPSAGNHFTGLPDSMDVVSLWLQIPSNNPEYTETSYYNERYLPTAWQEMQYIRRVKGTKVVICKICHLTTSGFPLNDEGMREYALWLVRCVLRNDLDGLDLDYEPTGQTFGTDYIIGDKFLEFVKIIGEYLGPQSG